MSPIFLRCWDLFLSLPPGPRKTHYLRSASPLYSHLYCHPQHFYQILPWVRTWSGRWERETECSTLTTKIRSWLWAIWAWPVLELTASWCSRAFLQEPRCDTHGVGTWLDELRSSWLLVLSSPLLLQDPAWFQTDFLSSVWSTSVCRKHSCAFGPNKWSASPPHTPLLCPRASLWPSSFPLDFWVWRG